MGLGINCVILANHLVSLITSSTTDPRFVAWGARLVLLVEQELPTNLEHTSSLSVFRGVRAAQSLVFWVVFCLSLFVCLSFFPFFGKLSVLLFTSSD